MSLQDAHASLSLKAVRKLLPLPAEDWVLVLDDAGAGFAVPGKSK